jgi:primary-amine oxidase
LDGHALSWQDWSMRIGFDAREGLTLHEVGLGGRPVLYRASIPEMAVPYGDPKFRYWQAYFDSGEYLVGKWANSLELGCDCLGEIAYLDAVVTDDVGEPRTITNAICVHEEDFGILWKHTDIFNGSAQSRRQRRLVVSYFTTVGNYDYGFYWYFYLDGTIECEIKSTGVLFTSAHPGGDHPYATEVAPGLAAPIHQHLFSARLDMTVAGLANAVEEVDVTGLPIGPDNPYGNAITTTVTRLTRESQAARRADGARGRAWRIISTEHANRYGRPVSYMWMKYISTPQVQAQQAITYGETPDNKLACGYMDKMQPGSCSEYHANAPASYLNSISLWKTPIATCDNGKPDCVPYSGWVTAWNTQVK